MAGHYTRNNHPDAEEDETREVHNVDDEDDALSLAIAMSLQDQSASPAPTTTTRPPPRAARAAARTQFIIDDDDDDEDDDDGDYREDSDMDIATPGRRNQHQPRQLEIDDVDDDDQAEEVQRAIQASMAAAPARSAVLLDGDSSDEEVEIVSPEHTRPSATASTASAYCPSSYIPSPTAEGERERYDQVIDMTEEDPEIQQAIALSLAQAAGASPTAPSAPNGSRKNKPQSSNGVRVDSRSPSTGNGSSVSGIRTRKSPRTNVQEHAHVTGLSRDRRLQALEDLHRFQPYQPPQPQRENEEQRERRLFREQQDREFQEALEQDRQRELQNQEAERQRVEEERIERERQRAEEERLAAKQSQKEVIVERAKQLMAESVPENEDDEFQVMLILPNGTRNKHSFSKRNPFSNVRAFAQLLLQDKADAHFELVQLPSTVLSFGEQPLGECQGLEPPCAIRVNLKSS